MRCIFLLGLFVAAGCATVSSEIYKSSQVCVHEMEVGVFGSDTDMTGYEQGGPLRDSYYYYEQDYAELGREYGNIGGRLSFRVDLTNEKCKNYR